MGLEATAWARLSRELAGQWTAERLTDRLSAGIPDVVWCTAEGVTGFWELKAVAREGIVLPWSSPAQPLWLWRWARGGGRAAVVVRTPERWVAWEPSREVAWVAWSKTTDVWTRVSFAHEEAREVLAWACRT